MHDSLNAPQLYGIEIAKKVEVDGGSELTEEFLFSEIHPVRCLRHNNHQQHFLITSIKTFPLQVKSLNKPKFAKPAAPSRGARRLTKAPPS